MGISQVARKHLEDWLGEFFGGLVWDMVTKTALVLLLLYGVLFVLRRFVGQQQSRRTGVRIELLSTAALGPGRSVHLLMAGGKVLLVGATGQQVSLLAELDADAAEIGPEPPMGTVAADIFSGRVGEYLEKLAGAWRRGIGGRDGGGRR